MNIISKKGWSCGELWKAVNFYSTNCRSCETQYITKEQELWRAVNIYSKVSELSRAHSSKRGVCTFTALVWEEKTYFTLLLVYGGFPYKFSNKYLFFP